MEDGDQGRKAAEARPLGAWAGEFMSTVRRLIRGPEIAEADDDEEAPKKRKRRLWGRWLGKMLPKETVVVPVEPRTEASVNRPDRAVDKPASRGPEAALATQTAAEQLATLNPNQVSPPSPSATEIPSTDTLHRPLSESNEVPKQPSEGAITESSLDLPRRRMPEFNASLASQSNKQEQTVYERQPQQSPERVSRIVERNPLSIALIGLEYMGRRRADRRLSREDQRLKQMVANVEKRLRLEEQAQHQLEQLARRSQDQVNELRLKRQNYEHQIDKQYKVSQPKSSSSPEAVAETPTKAETFRPMATPAAEQAVQRPAEVKSATPARPEVVFQEVVKAAEKNVPIEQAYERRHEIKDEGSRYSSGSISSAERAVIRSQIAAAQRMQSAGSAGSHPQPVVSTSPKSRPATDAQLYRQAMQRGFWGGVVTLIFLILILVLY